MYVVFFWDLLSDKFFGVFEEAFKWKTHWISWEKRKLVDEKTDVWMNGNAQRIWKKISMEKMVIENYKNWWEMMIFMKIDYQRKFEKKFFI